MLRISTNENLMAFGDFATRVEHNKHAFDELEIEIIQNMATIIGSNKIKDIIVDAKYLVSRYLNYLRKYYSKQDILDFMDTREHWKIEPDSMEEAAAIIVDASYSLTVSFAGTINSTTDSGFSFKPIMYMIGAINYAEMNEAS